MSIYLTDASQRMAERAVIQLEAARAARSNAPLAGDTRYEFGEWSPPSVRAERTKLVLAVLVVCLIVAAMGAVAVARWRVGLTWS